MTRLRGERLDQNYWICIGIGALLILPLLLTFQRYVVGTGPWWAQLLGPTAIAFGPVALAFWLNGKLYEYRIERRAVLDVYGERTAANR